MALIRAILLFIEKNLGDSQGRRRIVYLYHSDFVAQFPNLSKDMFFRHIELLMQAKLVEADIGGMFAISFGLTWDGCNYLDEIRDDTLFQKLCTVLDPNRPVSLETIRLAKTKLLAESIVLSVKWLIGTLAAAAAGICWYILG